MLIMKDGKVSRPHLKIASSSYTVAEITQLGGEWSKQVAGQFATKEELELTFSLFLIWLAQREGKENRSGNEK